MPRNRVEMIRARLEQALRPESLEIADESAKHAGHAGAQSGGGHFVVKIVSQMFEGKAPIQRHRLVYDAIGDAMHTEIHALSITAKTPDEVSVNL